VRAANCAIGTHKLTHTAGSAAFDSAATIPLACKDNGTITGGTGAYAGAAGTLPELHRTSESTTICQSPSRCVDSEKSHLTLTGYVQL
jgi:hypothetical protein